MRLKLSGIEKRFGGIVALRSAHLSAAAGEIVGLIGENGAGKSTLLKILAGVYPHGSYAGTIEVNDVVQQFSSTKAAEAAGVVIVHQELQLAADLTVAENLLLGAEPGKFGFIDGARLELAAAELLRKYDAAEIDPNARISTLGVGLQQKVEVIRALAKSAQVLILDEPTAALTHTEAESLLGWLRTIAASGTTCIYVSHRLDEVLALCQRVVVLRDGQTVAEEPTAGMTTEKLSALMVGHENLQVGASQRNELSSDTYISVSGLSLWRSGAAPTQPTLSKINCTIGRGEIVGVAGALGAGRTALMRALFGVARGPLAGTLTVGERRFGLMELTAERAVHAGIVLVPEDRKGQGVLLDLSIGDNLALAAAARDEGLAWDAPEIEAAARDAITQLGVRGSAPQLLKTLSGGNQQKVAIGKWLTPRPHLLLLDEPTRGVDVGAKEELYRLIEKQRDAGLSVLVASSDVPELERLCDRVLLLQRGELRGELRGKDLTRVALEQFITAAKVEVRVA